MKTELVIIQPTPFCNINCRYCYLPHRSVNKRIRSETLIRIFEQLFSSPFVSDEITIVWHAGEPLVLPISFYREAFQLVSDWNKKGIRVKNSFQTNATLITQEWCDFIKEQNIQIGVSLDGPANIHNANRIDRTGKGTLDRVLRGIALLQKNGIPFSIIAVITKNSLAYPDELWKFFMDLRPQRLGFNIDEIEGAHKQSSFQTDDDIYQYQIFFKRILELSDESSFKMSMREIESLTGHMRHFSFPVRSETNIPISILNFDCDGNVSTFSPELLTMTHPSYESFVFGNVFEGTLEDMLTNQNFVRVNTAIQQGVARCREICDYFMLCGGGCPSNKVSENGTFASTETINCRLKIKAGTNALIEHLEEKNQIVPSEAEHIVRLHRYMELMSSSSSEEGLDNNSPTTESNLHRSFANHFENWAGRFEGQPGGDKWGDWNKWDDINPRTSQLTSHILVHNPFNKWDHRISFDDIDPLMNQLTSHIPINEFSDEWDKWDKWDNRGIFQNT